MWPSVARYKPGQTSTDFEACDQNNQEVHTHGPITPSQFEQVQISQEFRPATKCYNPDHGDTPVFEGSKATGNPITCDADDNTNSGPLAKDEYGYTPVKFIPGGPTFKPLEK